MTIEDSADLRQFIDADDFAVTALYNGVTSIDVIMDRAYFEDTGGRLGTEGTAPVATILSVDIPSAAHGHTLVVEGVTYKFVGIEPDGMGITVVRLEKQ